MAGSSSKAGQRRLKTQIPARNKSHTSHKHQQAKRLPDTSTLSVAKGQRSKTTTPLLESPFEAKKMKMLLAQDTPHLNRTRISHRGRRYLPMLMPSQLNLLYSRPLLCFPAALFLCRQDGDACLTQEGEAIESTHLSRPKCDGKRRREMVTCRRRRRAFICSSNTLHMPQGWRGATSWPVTRRPCFAARFQSFWGVWTKVPRGARRPLASFSFLPLYPLL